MNWRINLLHDREIIDPAGVCDDCGDLQPEREVAVFWVGGRAQSLDPPARLCRECWERCRPGKMAGAAKR